MSNKRGWITFCILVLLFIAAMIVNGCAHGRARRGVSTKLVYASAKKIPVWITEIPEDKEYYYFVGSSGEASSLDEGKKQAVNDALKQVVETIGVKVTTESSQEEKYYAEEYQLNVSSKLLQKGEAKLQGAELKKAYYEKYERPDGSVFYRVWVLVKYSKQEIAREQKRLKTVLELRYGEVKRYEDEAAKFEKTHNYYRAIQFYVDAALSALKIEDGDLFFDRNLNRASILLSKISVKKYGEDQIGFVGKPLEKPLRLYVYTLDGKKEYPQKNVPVKFLYRIPRSKLTGYKYIIYNRKTDSNGYADLKIDKVYEVSDRNLVEARLDFSSEIRKLSSVPSKYRVKVSQFRTLANSMKRVFIFKSDTKARYVKTAIYIIQVDKDNTLFSKPVVAPEIYSVLYQKRFNVKLLDIPPSTIFGKNKDFIWGELVKASGKSVKRILFGYVKIISYEEISGFYVTQAIIDVNLYDKESSNIIFSWKFERSGTGSTREEAKVSVFTEIGRSLGEVVSRTMP